MTGSDCGRDAGCPAARLDPDARDTVRQAGRVADGIAEDLPKERIIVRAFLAGLRATLILKRPGA